MRSSSSRAIGFVTVLAVLLTVLPASAQYFGRNKVRYENFDFQVLSTEHFDIYFYPEERPGVDISARLAERWYTRLSRVLSHEMLGRQPLILYAAHPHFEQTNVIAGELGEATGGVTESRRRRIVLPLGRPLADIDHVIGHELVHAFQFDMTAAMSDDQNGLYVLPLWFVEGMAEYLSIGPADTNTAMWLRDAVQRNALPAIAQLDDPEYFPYRWGHAFWAYVGGRWGDRVIGQLLLSAAASGDVDVAIERVLDIKSSELSREWHEEMIRLYTPVLDSATRPEALGRRIVTPEGFASDVNVGPALSSNGRWLAFFSSRSIFSMDLYLADGESGRIARRLTSRSVNPHFSSVQFIHSAGAWDQSEQRLAIATVAAGQAALAIYDGVPDAAHRELPIAEVDEIFNPTWGPTSDTIAFTGSSGGLTDLYVYDMSTSVLRRLTNDAFAELQPAWSPDGQRIAFVTDRFSTDLHELSIGDYQLAVFDFAQGTVEQLPKLSQGNSFNPQWSPDGTMLYFLADPSGVPNLFRLTLSSGEVAQLTNVTTGISGITASSPALSVSARSGAMTFSVYEQGRYHIHAATPTELTPLELSEPSQQANNVLPPLNRRPGGVPTFLLDASTGLPKPMEHPTSGYTATLSLEAVGEPTVAVGGNRFGSQFGGDMSMYFRDVLGTHSLGFAVQSGSLSLTNTPAQFGYFNESRRWSFGVVAAQIPFVSGTFQTTTGTTPGGESVITDQTNMYRETQRTASAIVAYPFTRARRLELSVGLTQTSFDQVAYTFTYAENDGHLLAEQVDESVGPPSLTLAATSFAFVGDASNFGATGPVQGWRYRFEATPTMGSLDFASVLADFRRYFMPVPFYTVAVRTMHYGRYGSGGDDPRLYSLYLGYPSMVRGYHSATFGAADCGPEAPSSCAGAEHLFGSRLLVGNLEFRFPILRPFGVSSGMYGPMPAEVALFADTGVAWNGTEAPSWFGGTRSSVSSVGMTLRVSLGAGLIGQFDAVRPLDRPEAGWVYQFNLSPGF
jgi:Tol biopolymer transport system component